MINILLILIILMLLYFIFEKKEKISENFETECLEEEEDCLYDKQCDDFCKDYVLEKEEDVTDKCTIDFTPEPVNISTFSKPKLLRNVRFDCFKKTDGKAKTKNPNKNVKDTITKNLIFLLRNCEIKSSHTRPNRNAIYEPLENVKNKFINEIIKRKVLTLLSMRYPYGFLESKILNKQTNK